MSPEANTPKLRFAGFADPWEQRKLGELGSVVMCKRIYKEQTGETGDVPFFKIGTFGGEPDAFISRDLFEEYRNLYPFPKNGDVLISAAGTIGRTVVYQGECAYYQDSNIVWLDHDERLDNGFFLQYLNNQSWNSLEGSTLKRLYNKDILDASIALPPLAEQKVIGDCLTSLDNLITLHQRKHDSLTALKKALLEKMFPREGSSYPELRFEGFTDPWEQRKWSSCVSISTDMVDPKSGLYDNLSHIGPGNIESFTGRLYDNVHTVKEDCLISGKFHFHPGDVIYGKINPQLGKYVFAQVEGLASADAYVLNGYNGLNQEFLFSLLQTKRFFDYSVSVSMRSGMPKINRDELDAFEFLAPGEEEQQMIGGAFLSLDNLITLHQRKLKLLKNVKKSMLDKMFVQESR